MSTLIQLLKKAKPYSLMVFLQFGYAGMFIISVSCVKTGTNHYVLVVYRNLVAVLTMFPFAFWFERYDAVWLLHWYLIIYSIIHRSNMQENQTKDDIQVLSKDCHSWSIRVSLLNYLLNYVFSPDKIVVRC